MVSQLPVDGGFLYFAKRYVSPSFGFALGWLYVYNGAALVAAEVAAIAALINFWNDTINNAAWCALIIVIFFALVRLCHLVNWKLTEFPEHDRRSCIR